MGETVAKLGIGTEYEKSILLAVHLIQWRREGFCRPWQKSVVPLLQPGNTHPYNKAYNDIVTQMHTYY